MPILRNAVGDYTQSPLKKAPLMERKYEDFDLAFADHRIYLIDEHEWFDPKTSTKYDDGVSRHAMRGPSFIVVHEQGGGMTRTEDHHVNDPRVWAWLRRCIAEGHLTAATLIKGLDDERGITIKEPEPRRKKRTG